MKGNVTLFPPNRLQVDWEVFVMLARRSGLRSKKQRAIKKRGKSELMKALRAHLEVNNEG